MAHVGEEFRFRAVGEHGALAGLLQFAFTLLKFGHVGCRADQVERTVRRLHHALAGDLVPLAALEIRCGLLDLKRHSGEKRLAVALHEDLALRTEDLRVRQADRLVAGYAGQLRPAPVDIAQPQIRMLGVDGHRDIVDKVPEQLVLMHAGLQGRLALLQLRDVDPDADERPVGRPHVEHLVPLAVRTLPFIGGLALVVALAEAIHPGGRVRVVERIQFGIPGRPEIPRGMAGLDGLAQRLARLHRSLHRWQRILHQPVGEHEPVVAIVDDHARRQRFDDVLKSLTGFLGVGLPPLHLGDVEQEAGDIVLAGIGPNPGLAHQPRLSDALELEVLLDLVGFACPQHLPLGHFETRGLRRRDEMAAHLADHLRRLQAEHFGEGLVGEHEAELRILHEYRIAHAVDDSVRQSRAFQRLGELRLALLHVGNVEIGHQPLAARKLRDRVDHGAAVGPLELARLYLAPCDLGQPRGDILLPLRVGHIVDAVVAVDVHQGAERAADADILRLELPDVVEGAVDHLAMQARVEHDDAHLHRIHRALQVLQQCAGMRTRFRERLLVTLQVGNIGADADRAPIVGAHVAAQDPAPIGHLDGNL
jgi:hypothetical protein